ncbi:DUF748 domain-containing protein [Limnobacter sp.]|uniref:DUF748 domain-containing protein n=1 Tax=Limnobacter sp. TaxID=2003368 RepID=UPI003518A9A5
MTFIRKLIRSKLLIGFVAFVALLYLFAWQGLPRLVQWQAPKFLQQKSGHTLTLGLPQVNPFKLTVALPDVALATPQGEPLVSFGHLYVDVSGTDLFKGLVALDQIELRDLALNTVLLPEGKTNFTALLDAFKSEEPQPPPGELPALRLGHLVLANGAIQFEDQRSADGLKTSFAPLNLELRNISTRAEQNGEFVLNADSALDAQLALKAQVLLAQGTVDGELSLKGLNVAKLAPLLGPMLPTEAPQGTLNLAFNFETKLPEAPAPTEAEPTPQASPLELRLHNMNLQLNNFAVAANARKGAPQASLKALTLDQGEFVLGTNTFTLQNLALGQLAVSEGGTNPLRITSLQAGPLNVNLNQQHASLQALRLQGGQVDVLRNAQGQINLQTLAQAWVPAGPAKAAPKASSASNSNTEPAPSKPWTYAIEQVELAGLGVNYNDAALQPPLQVGLNNIQIKTSGITHNLNTELPLAASMNVAHGGRIQLDGTVNPATTAVAMNVDIQALGLQPAQGFIGQVVKLNLASGAVYSKGKAIYNSQQQSYTGSLTVAGLRLNEAGTNTPFLQWKRLFTPSLAASAKGVQIGLLQLEGLDTALLIAKDQSTNISRLLVEQAKPAGDGPAPTEPSPSKPQPAQPPAFAVSIDRFTVADSKLDFADESLFIPFGTRIHSLEGTVNGLSNQPNARGEVALEGTVDEFGQAKANGAVNLADPTAFLNMDVRFNNLAMKNLTPYTATFANRKIESGKLSLNLKYNIENRQLNSSNQVIIDKLTLGERVQSPKGRDLPLELAVAVLEDRNGRIDLGLPITGSLDDPQFSFGAIVWKAIGNVISKIATAPFRALGALLGGGQEEALGNVAFEPGKTNLSPPQRENLATLAQALNNRPNLGLELNGTWANADRVAMQALQLRRAVAQQTGAALQAGQDPGPLALQAPATQKALEALFEKSFGGGELASLKAGYRKANPGQLEQSAAGAALGQITSLFKDTRELSDTEVAALKGKDFYAVLAQKLQDAQDVPTQALLALAQTRQQQLGKTLTEAGVASERIQLGEPKQVQANAQGEVEQALALSVK